MDHSGTENTFLDSEMIYRTNMNKMIFMWCSESVQFECFAMNEKKRKTNFI